MRFDCITSGGQFTIAGTALFKFPIQQIPSSFLNEFKKDNTCVCFYHVSLDFAKKRLSTNQNSQISTSLDGTILDKNICHAAPYWRHSFKPDTLKSVIEKIKCHCLGNPRLLHW